jgi:FixJ family two-component response regulator
MTEPDTVIVVDDDLAVRQAVGRVLRSVDLHVRLHGSVQELLLAKPPDVPTCIVLDVRLPGKSGLDLQRDLAAAGINVPIVFISAHGDIPMTVQAIKAGAIEFLPKPFRDQDLINAVQAGLAQDRDRLRTERALAGLQARFNTLTPRERGVMASVVAGHPNKNIAAELGVSEITVKYHRANVMRKMAATSLAELVSMAQQLNGRA